MSLLVPLRDRETAHATPSDMTVSTVSLIYRILRSLRPLTACVLVLVTSGCGYIVGNPFGAEVRTVHVPLFTNDTFRRGFELRLTEAVQKQIQLTPFRVVGADDADTRLTGRIIDIKKRNINQNKYDDAREYEFTMAVEVTWEDLRTGQILAQRQLPLSHLVADTVANTSFAPEPGQSMAIATQDAVDQLARQIVGLMEAPW